MSPLVVRALSGYSEFDTDCLGLVFLLWPVPVKQAMLLREGVQNKVLRQVKCPLFGNLFPTLVTNIKLATVITLVRVI